MSEDEPQTEGMKALEQSLNDHMEICRLQRKAKRLKAEVANLKAEVERLRKAGDAMLPFFVYPPYEKGSHNAVLNWNAAKEGKQP